MPMKRMIDISPSISERMGVFPGDVPFRREVSLDFKKGHHLLLSSISTTLHIGAHADGSNHYSSSGVAIHERDLALYMGPCLVLRAQGHARGERISWRHLSEKWREMKRLPAERVLLRTDSFPQPDRWNSDFCSFDPSLIEGLAERGAKLIGIDTPSIDPETSKGLESHQMVSRFDLAVLEGLVLTDADEGLYTLIALPLKIEGADAAPVRAVLLEGEGIGL